MNVTGMFEGVSPEWRALIAKSEEHLKSAIKAVNGYMTRTPGAILRPDAVNVLAAFRECPWDKLSVVLIGQDPYPNATACGLSFSVRGSLQPSVRSILKVCGIGEFYSGDLTPWARRGVLLLNLSLTTIDGESDAHKDYWREFVEGVIENLGERDGLIYILLGGPAQTIAPKISPRQTILKWGHPSPLSRYNQIECPENFSHCDCFTQVNKMIPGWTWGLTTWIFTDGACSGNGRENAAGAWAFYVATIDGIPCANPINTFSGKLPATPKATNNRAELLSILAALRWARTARACNITIVSDSEYAIGAATVNKVNANTDIVTVLRSLVRELHVKFKHVPGHGEMPAEDSSEMFFWRGNDIVDKAARAAC